MPVLLVSVYVPPPVARVLGTVKVLQNPDGQVSTNDVVPVRLTTEPGSMTRLPPGANVSGTPSGGVTMVPLRIRSEAIASAAPT